MDCQETPSYQGFLPERRRLGWRRLALRAAVAVLALAAVDSAVARLAPEPRATPDWRMPRVLPTSSLEPFIRSAEKASRDSTEMTVAFLGASPAWGDAVENDAETVPANFERIADSAGTPTRVYNLACNGQLLGDTYFIAERIADDVDLVVVQLTYHAFNPEWREGSAERYPELPDMLGVPVDAELAGTLGCDESPRLDLTGDVDRWLQAHWRLWGARDRLVAPSLGSSIETALFERWQRLTMPDYAGEEQMVAAGVPFDELMPDEQMLVMDEFTSVSSYRYAETDSEARMLERLASELQAEGHHALFYVSPVNVEALESFDLFDRAQYAANVSHMRSVVEAHGHRFVDMNAECSLPSSAFADVNHTTAEGSLLVAEKLATRTFEGAQAP